MLLENKTMENSIEELEDMHRNILPRVGKNNTKDKGKDKIHL